MEGDPERKQFAVSASPIGSRHESSVSDHLLHLLLIAVINRNRRTADTHTCPAQDCSSKSFHSSSTFRRHAVPLQSPAHAQSDPTEPTWITFPRRLAPSHHRDPTPRHHQERTLLPTPKTPSPRATRSKSLRTTNTRPLVFSRKSSRPLRSNSFSNGSRKR